MPISFFARLINSESFSFADFAHPNGDEKLFAQKFTQFFGKFFAASRKQINILRHSRLADISIYGLCAEQNDIFAPLQKF